MPRPAIFNEETLEIALEAIKNRKTSIRNAVKEYRTSFAILAKRSRVKKKNENLRMQHAVKLIKKVLQELNLFPKVNVVEDNRNFEILIKFDKWTSSTFGGNLENLQQNADDMIIPRVLNLNVGAVPSAAQPLVEQAVSSSVENCVVKVENADQNNKTNTTSKRAQR